MLDNYVERVLGIKRSSKAQISAFDRLVRPEIGTRSIYDLRRADIAQLLNSVEDSSGPVQADRTLAYLRKAFHWQERRDDNLYRRLFVAWHGPRERNEHATAS